MAYYLNTNTIKRPSRMRRSFIFVSDDTVSLSGKTTRDFTARKEEFILEYDYLTHAQAQDIIDIIENTFVPIPFEVDEENLTVNETQVIASIKKRSYKVPGSSFIESLTITLIEVS